MKILKKFRTEDDREYFDEKGKLNDAAREGKLGKSWYKYNPKKGEYELKPKGIFKRI